jgi:hypothetical protein
MNYDTLACAGARRGIINQRSKHPDFGAVVASHSWLVGRAVTRRPGRNLGLINFRRGPAGHAHTMVPRT